MLMDDVTEKGKIEEAPPAYRLITEAGDLDELARQLAAQDRIAVDTESNSLHAYREQVCLIQFSIPAGDFMVDPLALEDLSALRPIFEDPKIEKVFHAAEYDLLCLHRDFEIECNNLFDTMQAARLLGRTELGLGALLETEFGVVLNKRYQRADWGERPLSPELLDYARMDTHLLLALRDRLAAELAERGLTTLAQEDFRRVTILGSLEGGRGGTERPVEWHRVSGAYDLTPQQAAILQELALYRNEEARELDRPLFKVIHDHTLAAIAVQGPKNKRELAQVPGMTMRQVRRHADGLLAAVKRGIKAAPLYPPRPVRPDERYLNRLEALRTWRKNLAQEVGVTSDVILPREVMSEIAAADPHTLEELGEVMKDSPWRFEKFGEMIFAALPVNRRK